MLLTRIILPVACFSLLAGCTDHEPTPMERAVAQIETAVGSAATIGFATSAAVTATGNISIGAPMSCLETVSTTCDGSNWPCQTQLRIALEEGCPLPLTIAARGTVEVQGSWTGPGVGTVVAGFGDVVIEDGLVLARAEAVQASWGLQGAIGNYAGANVEVSPGRPVLAEGSAWTVVTGNAGTPDDPSDDFHMVTGGHGIVDGAIYAVELDGIVVDASCSLNPIAGHARASWVADDQVATVELAFHGACDGKADIVSMIGVDVELEGSLRVGASVELDFGG